MIVAQCQCAFDVIQSLGTSTIFNSCSALLENFWQFIEGRGNIFSNEVSVHFGPNSSVFITSGRKMSFILRFTVVEKQKPQRSVWISVGNLSAKVHVNSRRLVFQNNFSISRHNEKKSKLVVTFLKNDWNTKLIDLCTIQFTINFTSRLQQKC